LTNGLPILLVTGSLLLLPATGYGGDPAEGERLARRACAFCHSIAAKPSPMADAPAFVTIARSKKFRVQGVQLITGTRVKMPAFPFTDEQADDIAAYLKVLANRRVPP
jgi:mono/diheme cytochrome c family protein